MMIRAARARAIRRSHPRVPIMATTPKERHPAITPNARAAAVLTPRAAQRVATRRRCVRTTDTAAHMLARMAPSIQAATTRNVRMDVITTAQVVQAAVIAALRHATTIKYAITAKAPVRVPVIAPRQQQFVPQQPQTATRQAWRAIIRIVRAGATGAMDAPQRA